MDILRAEKVTKRYANHTALSGVSLAVPESSIYGLLGPNGAGKTSLIRIINMITAPDEGRVLFRNEMLCPSHKESIGYLPEERGLYKKMKVGEQALYLAMLKGMKKSEAHARLKEWFERFDIGAWWNRRVEELSKGMQQKVQFIVTVLHRPGLLIFDEPFSGFDPINAGIVKDEILRLRSEGASIIFSTHNMGSVEELCDDIALINKSNVILQGSVKSIKNTYRTNTFYIELENLNKPLEGIIGERFSILECRNTDNIASAKVKLPDGETPNAMLSALLPHCTVHAMHEIVPTMNDIFISRVSEDMRSNGYSSSLTE
jgi:ABC-2 type transport system ATP-binding protein